MKFVAYANERYLGHSNQVSLIFFSLTSTARCHNHRKFVASCIMGTQHWPGDVYWFLLQHGGLRQYGRIIIAWGDYNSSVSLIDLCSLLFHSVRPLALRPVTMDAAREGLVKI